MELRGLAHRAGNMTKIFDIFTKKEKTQETLYRERADRCIQRVFETNKPCDCKLCRDKRILADKVVNFSNQLCCEYVKATNNQLAMGDFLEIMIMAQYKVQELTFPKN